MLRSHCRYPHNHETAEGVRGLSSHAIISDASARSWARKCCGPHDAPTRSTTAALPQARVERARVNRAIFTTRALWCMGGVRSNTHPIDRAAQWRVAGVPAAPARLRRRLSSNHPAFHALAPQAGPRETGVSLGAPTLPTSSSRWLPGRRATGERRGALWQPARGGSVLARLAQRHASAQLVGVPSSTTDPLQRGWRAGGRTGERRRALWL